MKKALILFTSIFLSLNAHALVVYDNDYVVPEKILPSCKGEYFVKVGFFTYLETNNDKFSIQRSKDPGFSMAITSTPLFNGHFNGCGTCGPRQYSVLDYGPFQPNEIWFYRVKAISNAGNVNYRYISYFIVPTPTSLNTTNQVTHNVVTGSSPATESSYVWGQQTIDNQAINISMMATEISKIYLEQNNNTITFEVVDQTPFTSLEVNIDNAGFYSIYNSSPVTNHTWTNSANAINSLGNHTLSVRFTNCKSY